MKHLPTEIRDVLLSSFLRYVRIDTQSDSNSPTTPSTKKQEVLADLLVEELQQLGLSVSRNKYSCVIARKQGTVKAPPIALLAHLDTALEVSGKDVNPLVWENYDGKDMNLGNGYSLSPNEYPELAKYEGNTIITTDGNTLLGADDKAGIAEIMGVLHYLKQNPEYPHGDISIIFNPDEEIGKGSSGFDIEDLQAEYAITVDGQGDGKVYSSCFNAYGLTVDFYGRAAHPGSGRGKLINAVTMAAHFLTLLPALESPEASDQKQGFYCPTHAEASIERAKISMIIRDYDIAQVRRRIDTVRHLAESVKSSYPGSDASVTEQKQYLNMENVLKHNPTFISMLLEAIREGSTAQEASIRGGCDAAHLCEEGIPTANLSAGFHAVHSRYEWIALESMLQTARSILAFLRMWAEGGNK